MKTFSKIIVTMMSFFTGMTITSLWITDTEQWKIYLPVILILICMRMGIDEVDEERNS